MERYNPYPKNKKREEELRIEVWGPFACFTRPELKTERVSYKVMTPSAARNILQAIYWHPGVNYEITAIKVMKPVQFIQMKRNELKSKISPTTVLSAVRQNKSMYLNSDKDIMQRSSLILKDVHYIIHAKIVIHPEQFKTDEERIMLENIYNKTKNLLIKRTRNGQCLSQPYFGIKEYPCNFRLIEKDEKTYPMPITEDLGIMLYDLNYKNPENIIPVFFHATIRNGIMDLHDVKLWIEQPKDEITTAPPQSNKATQSQRSYK